METLKTPITQLFGIKHPIILAGMNVAAGPSLAAAVCNAGGLGVVGGVGYTPELLQEMIDDLKEGLVDKNAPFGVDLLLPKIGGGARATNYDYTKGELPALLDVIINSGAKLFVCAIGVPPTWAVERLHKAGIVVQNMIGSPKHVAKALAAGVDVICAQGGEGGGHTGEVATSILIPAVADLCRGRRSPLTGGPVLVVAAGGISDGRGLAAALALGASAVWVGTRFVASVEGDAPDTHKEAVVTAGYHDTIRTLVFSGRPMRIKKNAYDATRLGPSGQRPAPASPLTLHAHPAPPARLQVRDELGGGARRGDEVSAQEGQAAVHRRRGARRLDARAARERDAVAHGAGRRRRARDQARRRDRQRDGAGRGRHRARQRGTGGEVVARSAAS